MVSRHPNIWKWLPLIALGLMLVGDFAPISDSLDRILSGVAIAILLAFSGTYFWQERRARQADQSNSAAISSKDQT
jgi:type VI protein secretion system component VasK